ncbi:MFS transporter [Armatimonas rosea]|uniref:MFS family permease n=1 Tax=Armatimonas rosea TaxID=685828 RepID=A0A7W9W6C4_ARMRO|nr:MFS transporter [Armatimonas rosea]MBB6049890.1 MFS family permease [Armatimonas rosea]
MSVASHDDKNLKWYQGIPKYSWMVLIIAALGWLFDAMDQNLFNMVRAPSVKALLELTGLAGKELDDAAKLVGAQLTATFLVGWAFGGFIFGMIGDKLGRTRTMMLTILIYAVFTGLNGLVQNLPQYFICRFITALGVGGEFAAGAALVAEVWPNRSRPMALGTLQALSAIGNMGAAVVNLLAGADWRVVYFVGAAPALMVLWIRSSVKEPEAWHEAKEKAATTGEIGNIASLFSDPTLRKNTIAGTLIALAGVGGLWGVGFFLPDLIRTVLGPNVAAMDAVAGKKQLGQWVSIAFIFQNVGAFLGMFGYAALSERVGRKPALALFLLLAYGSIQLAFWGVRDLNTAYVLSFVLGFCALAPFSAFAVYFPELYPTRLRATGIGFCYNCARLLAAAAPFALGGLAKAFNSPTDPAYGFRIAAAIVASIYIFGFVGLAFAPETKGKPLPE